MDTLKFPETDLAEMKQFYQEELEKTLKRLQHIKSVLEKLGDSSQTINIEVSSATGSAAGSTGQQPKVQKRKRRRRPGRKSMWEELIVKELKKKGLPMTYEDLTDEIMKYGNIPESKRENTKRAITNLVFRLRKQNRKLTTISSGTREKFIILKSWQQDDGSLKDEFKPPAPRKKAVPKKAAPKKRGRKPKKVTAKTAKKATPEKAAAKPKAVKAEKKKEEKAKDQPAKS